MARTRPPQAGPPTLQEAPRGRPGCVHGPRQPEEPVPRVSKLDSLRPTTITRLRRIQDTEVQEPQLFQTRAQPKSQTNRDVSRGAAPGRSPGRTGVAEPTGAISQSWGRAVRPAGEAEVRQRALDAAARADVGGAGSRRSGDLTLPEHAPRGTGRGPSQRRLAAGRLSQGWGRDL